MRALAPVASFAVLASAVACVGCRNLSRAPDRAVSVERAEECLAAGDLAGARRHYLVAADASPRYGRARVGLARVALAGGDAQTALKEAARAEKECTLAREDAIEIRIIRGRAHRKLGRPPSMVWAYLYPAYEAGDAETKTDLYRDLVSLAGQLPSDAPGLRAFLAEARPGASAPWQRIRARREWDPGGRSTASIPMGTPARITIHHSAHDAFIAGNAARSASASADLIRRMRDYHVQNRHWEDIAYHFIIDPRGEMWEGRSVRFQGAHAAAHNKGNIGICLIGNYDAQNPSAAQARSLKWLVDYLRRKYAIPKDQLFAHGELTPTTCPGKNLKRIVVQMRR